MTTILTHFASDLVPLASVGDLIEVSLLRGPAPKIIVDWPGGQHEITDPDTVAAIVRECPDEATQAIRVLADTSDRLDRLEGRAHALADLSR